MTEPAEKEKTRRARVRVLLGLEEPREQDRPLRMGRRGGLFIAGALMPLLAWAAARFPNAVERFYTNAVGQWIARGLAAVSGLVPFSVAEVLIVLLLLWLIGCVGRAVYHVARGRRRALNAAAGGLLYAGAAAGVLLIVFYGAWAFNFARADLVARMGWTEYAENGKAQVDPAELERLCEELVAVANAEYERATGAKDLGKPTALASPATVDKLDAAIDAAYEKIAARFALHPSFGASRGPAKPVAFSELMCYLGIGGFYSPWSGEANYNAKMPPMSLPQTIAHEKSHQRGVTNEDEANFYGFLACIASDDPYARYSGYLFAQRQLLSALLRQDRARGETLLKQRYKGVQRDVDAARRFWRAYEGPARKASRAVNDTYLKANRVKGGVKAYGRSAELIVIFSRMNNGSVK